MKISILLGKYQKGIWEEIDNAATLKEIRYLFNEPLPNAKEYWLFKITSKLEVSK